MSQLNRILLLDDDPKLCDVLNDYLSRENFNVSSVNDGESALSLLDEEVFDIAIIDIVMPGMGGLDVLNHIRKVSSMPVIILSGRSMDIDRIIGLELGADDYMGKPFNPRELLARVHSILRRSKQQTVETISQPANDHTYDIRLDKNAYTASINGLELDLTLIEFSILQQLLAFNGKVVTKDELYERALDRPLTPFDRSLDMHISRLRKKLNHSIDRSIIRTIRGIGYQLLP